MVSVETAPLMFVVRRAIEAHVLMTLAVYEFVKDDAWTASLLCSSQRITIGITFVWPLYEVILLDHWKMAFSQLTIINVKHLHLKSRLLPISTKHEVFTT